MNKLKKLLAVLVCAAMALALVPGVATAAVIGDRLRNTAHGCDVEITEYIENATELSVGTGGSIGKLGTEAKVTDIGADGSTKTSLSMSREYKDDKLKLTLTSKKNSVLVLSLPASGAGKGISVVVNGSAVSFSADDGIPFVEDGHTYVPLRAVAEAYGATVGYNGDTQDAVIEKDGVTVKVPIGDNFVYRNGEKVKNDAPAKIANNRTYLPIRIVMELLGAKVGWDGATSTVTVYDEDLMFIRGFETAKKMTGNLWAAWEKANALRDAGSNHEAIEAYRKLGSRFLDEGAVNSAILFQHLGECYAKLGEYHNASLCYSRSSYYWSQDPAEEQTALYFANLSASIDGDAKLYLKTSDPAYDRTKYFGSPGEPKNGILLGAYAEADRGVSNPGGELYFTGFPRLTGIEHGLYLLYLPYGADISGYESHFREAARRGCVIEIGLQPTSGLDAVKADSYLVKMAEYMENSGCQFLLRFANEMNEVSTPWYTEDYNKYIETFRNVATVFKEYAPSVGIVWAPNFFPQNNIDRYYPGDEYVDYVGLSVYEEYNTDNDPLGEGKDRDHWINILDGVYERYADRKPIIVAEGGCNYQSITTGEDVTGFAAAQMLEYYTYLPIKYPNLKMTVLYDADETNAGAGYYPRKFLLSNNPTLLDAYKKGISNTGRYLANQDDVANEYYYELFQNVTLPAKKVEICGYISSPSGNYNGVAYLLNGVKVAESYAMPYTVELDLSQYAGQSVELRILTFGDGPSEVDKTFKVQVE